MASLDVDSLFTNIPLNETINVCIDNLYSNTDIYKGIPKREFKTLLETATTLRGLIFAKTYFHEVKIIVFREDLFSRISHFENFREDLFSRLGHF